MSENSKIEWCDHTFNPWEGCTKVSPGCAHCYAESRNHRFGMDNWGKDKPRRRTSASNWKKPLQWNENARYVKDSAWRPRVFCASLADWLDDEVPIDWFADLMHLIRLTPNVDWLLLTKRPQNFLSRVLWANGHLAIKGDIENPKTDPFLLTAYMLADWHNGKPPNNVWIGTSIEDQQRADERIPELLKIPAKVRFLSVEPMLEMIDFTSHFLRSRGGLQWVIFGGESGVGARPCNVGWIRAAGTQCRLYHIAPFVKQVGSNPWLPPRELEVRRSLPGYKPLTHPKGGDPSEWPEDLRVREFPKV